MSGRKVYLETFGCQMNELDSELVSGQLRALGYTFTPRPDDADVVLYNTCSVREHAEQKVWSRLGEMQIRKGGEPELVVGVLGCMAERDGAELIKRMPVVDILCGPGELDKLPSLLDNAVRTRASLVADDDHPSRRSAGQVALQGSTSRRSSALAAAQDTLELLDLSRAISPVDDAAAWDQTGEGVTRRSAYVRITRGCNKFCTYCVVPFTRGAEVHRPPEHILDECRKLADAGVVEVTLLGQTVNHYRFEHGAAVSVNGILQPQKGRAFAGGHRRDPLAGASTTTFADLLAMIHEKVPAIKRLRFVTSYPRDFGDDVLEVIRDHPRICRYLHVPVQSGSDRMLKMMNRGYTVSEYLEFVDRARHYLHQPEASGDRPARPLSISSDFIVGFPTETEEDFEATVALVERCRFKNSFIFKYSPRPGTTAYDKLPDDVPEDVKRRRNNTLLGVQNAIADSVSREMIGREFDVIVEGPSRMERKKARPQAAPGTVALTLSAKNAAQAPESSGTPGEPIQLSSRTDGDNIVFFDAPAGVSAESLAGRIVRVRITAAKNLSLMGELCQTPLAAVL
jgi:tRNA-2-methylthio-N6-dimethylallyladenosine synthase